MRWLKSRLSPSASTIIDRVGASRVWKGQLVHIHIAESASYEMEELEQAELIAGKGIVGDRYFTGTGTYSPKPDVREVTLIEIEALEAMARGDPPFPGVQVTLRPIEHRRNLTTRGVPLNHLVGKRFRVGDVVLRGFKLAEPCTYLEGLTRPGVRRALVHRAGLRAEIVEGGTISVGDPVEVVEA